MNQKSVSVTLVMQLLHHWFIFLQGKVKGVAFHCMVCTLLLCTRKIKPGRRKWWVIRIFLVSSISAYFTIIRHFPIHLPFNPDRKHNIVWTITDTSNTVSTGQYSYITAYCKNGGVGISHFCYCIPFSPDPFPFCFVILKMEEIYCVNFSSSLSLSVHVWHFCVARLS